MLLQILVLFQFSVYSIKGDMPSLSQQTRSNGTVIEIIEHDPNYIRVGMCNPTAELKAKGVRFDLCNCEHNVVSCDFSKLKSDIKTQAEVRAFWEEDSVNRICLCNAPSNVQLILAERFISGYWNVTRIDIENVERSLIIDHAFERFFAGDLYMSKINLLLDMISWEYGRGQGRDRRTSTWDPTVLKCCSNIKTHRMDTPSFFMKDSIIQSVHGEALNDEHLWNNIIFENVTFKSLDTYGIALNRPEINASFTNCHFHNVNRSGIAVNDVANLLMAHNTFHTTCHQMPLGLRSVGYKSHIALLQNIFENPTTFEIDGKRVAVWFNLFKKWDSTTFPNIEKTRHADRVVSIEFNSVAHYEMNSTDIGTMNTFDKIVISQNIIAPCDCSVIAKLNLPKIFKNYTQRCFTENSENKEMCHLEIKDIESQCSKTSNNKLNYPKLCRQKDLNQISFIYANEFKQLVPFLNSIITSDEFRSPFITEMLELVKTPFKMPANKRKATNGYKPIWKPCITLHLLPFYLALIVANN